MRNDRAECNRLRPNAFENQSREKHDVIRWKDTPGPTTQIMRKPALQVLAEDNPTLQAWDQDQWALRLGYGKRKMSDAMDTFRRVRADNYNLLKELPAEAYARTATHTERGTMTLLDLVQLIAGHPEGHVRQIQGARAAYKAHRAASLEANQASQHAQ